MCGHEEMILDTVIMCSLFMYKQNHVDCRPLKFFFALINFYKNMQIETVVIELMYDIGRGSRLLLLRINLYKFKANESFWILKNLMTKLRFVLWI